MASYTTGGGNPMNPDPTAKKTATTASSVLSGQKTTVTTKGNTTTTTRGSLGGGGDTLTMAQAVTKLKEAGIPYGGQAGSQLKDWDAISKYFNTNIVSANYSDTSPGTGFLGNLQPKPGVIKAVSGTAGTPGAAAGGLPAVTSSGGAANSGGSGKKSTDYAMLDEPRFSQAQMDNYRSFYGKMKGGRVAPTAQLLSAYRGYGGPRSTAIGNPNVQTATKMLLGS